jgi:hypothetical protein
MAPSAILRAALRARPTAAFRVARSPVAFRPVTAAFSTSKFQRAHDAHDPHGEETFEEFSARYAAFVKEWRERRRSGWAKLLVEVV